MDVVESLADEMSLYNLDSSFLDVDILRRSLAIGGGSKLLCVISMFFRSVFLSCGYCKKCSWVRSNFCVNSWSVSMALFSNRCSKWVIPLNFHELKQ